MSISTVRCGALREQPLPEVVSCDERVRENAAALGFVLIPAEKRR